MKKHNVCEIGCDRIVPGDYECSAPNKVKNFKMRERGCAVGGPECFPFNEKYIKILLFMVSSFLI